MTIVDWDRGMVCHPTVALLLAQLLRSAPPLAAQSPADSAAHHENGPRRAWVSLGLGSGNSYVGGFPAARAAVSIAVNRTLMFTLEETGMGSLSADRNVASTNLLIGAQTADPHQFLFLAAGPAMTTCGNGCPGQSGIAVDGGVHVGVRHAGVGLVGFAVRAPGHNRCRCNSSNVSTSASGIVVSIDVGWFEDRRAPPN
jgi:hypothetical protein